MLGDRSYSLLLSDKEVPWEKEKERAKTVKSFIATTKMRPNLAQGGCTCMCTSCKSLCRYTSSVCVHSQYVCKTPESKRGKHTFGTAFPAEHDSSMRHPRNPLPLHSLFVAHCTLMYVLKFPHRISHYVGKANLHFIGRARVGKRTWA